VAAASCRSTLEQDAPVAERRHASSLGCCDVRNERRINPRSSARRRRRSSDPLANMSRFAETEIEVRAAPVSASIALGPMDHRLLGRSVFHDKNLGLRLPLVDLAVALTPGWRISPLRGWGRSLP
jgi:hypothetical protein